MPGFKENLDGKSLKNLQNQRIEVIKRVEKNCYIPALVHVCPYIENG